jgi:hypothetical protein
LWKNKDNNEIPTAYQTTTTADAQTMNHAKWNNFITKNVSKNGNVNYKDFKKDSKELQAYLMNYRQMSLKNMV